jgi:hypothetical protein
MIFNFISTFTKNNKEANSKSAKKRYEEKENEKSE